MSINISLFTCTPGLAVQAFINMHYADEIIGNNRWLNDKSKLVIDIKKNNSILNLLKQRRFQLMLEAPSFYSSEGNQATA